MKVSFNVIQLAENDFRLAYHLVREAGYSSGFIHEPAPCSTPYRDINALRKKLGEFRLPLEIADTAPGTELSGKVESYDVTSAQLRSLGFQFVCEHELP